MWHFMQTVFSGLSMSFEIGGESSGIEGEVVGISHFICMVWVV